MLKFLRKKIGIIGYGNMGQAIAAGIKSKYRVFVFDKDKTKIQAASGIEAVADIARLVDRCQVIILAVKPQDFESVLLEAKNSLRGKLVISIAAGITTEYIQRVLGSARVVRVMPNLAVKVGKSTTAICKGIFATGADIKLAERIFKYLGEVFIFGEDKMDAATAISGSGPAYIFYDLEINAVDPLKIPKDFKDNYIKKLMDAAMAVGFNVEVARCLSIDTVASSEGLLIGTGNSPAQLRKMVTSPGGTTEAAIKTIIDGGSWAQAAIAARKRAQELSKKG